VSVELHVRGVRCVWSHSTACVFVCVVSVRARVRGLPLDNDRLNVNVPYRKALHYVWHARPRGHWTVDTCSHMHIK